jgi:hypothetical protein
MGKIVPKRGGITSPEFQEWFDRVTTEFAAEPFPLTDAAIIRRAQNHGRSEVYTNGEPQSDLAKWARTLDSPTQMQQETNPMQPVGHQR